MARDEWRLGAMYDELQFQYAYLLMTISVAA